MHEVNVIVSLNQPADPQQQVELTRAIGQGEGIAHAVFSPRSARLMLVGYDPFATTAQRILAQVSSHGLDARLVGL